MKKQQPKPKSKLDSLMSEQTRLNRMSKFSNTVFSEKEIAANRPYIVGDLARAARYGDSARASNNRNLIKKELVNIKPTKPVVKSKADNTKVSKPTVAKKIVKSQILVKKKK